MCCKPYHRNILLQLLLSYCRYGVHAVDRTRANQPHLTFQSHARSKITLLINRVKYTCDVTRDPSSNRQLYQCNDCNGRSQLYGATWQHVVTYRLCSVELWNIKVVKPTGSYWGDLWRRMCRLSLRSQSRRHLIVTNWAAAVVHQCEHVNTHRWTTFQLLSLWLSVSRRDCDLKRHMRRQVAYRSRCSARPLIIWMTHWL